MIAMMMMMTLKLKLKNEVIKVAKEIEEVMEGVFVFEIGIAEVVVQMMMRWRN